MDYESVLMVGKVLLIVGLTLFAGYSYARYGLVVDALRKWKKREGEFEEEFEKLKQYAREMKEKYEGLLKSERNRTDVLGEELLKETGKLNAVLEDLEKERKRIVAILAERDNTAAELRAKIEECARIRKNHSVLVEDRNANWERYRTEGGELLEWAREVSLRTGVEDMNVGITRVLFSLREHEDAAKKAEGYVNELTNRLVEIARIATGKVG